MTFSTAMRLYIGLLFIAVFALVIVLPSSIRFDFGKQNVCRLVGNATLCSTLYRVPDSVPLTITRPALSLEKVGIPFTRRLEFSYGLDIRGGSEVTLVADLSGVKESDRLQALESARTIISKRIDLYGLAESSVTTAVAKDSYRLIASIPGITESQGIVSLIGSTAQLDFREFKPATPSAVPASPSGMLVKDFVSSGLTGKDLLKANAILDQASNRPAISLEFSPEGTKKFAEITKKNIGKPLAIFLDEYPMSAPTVQSEITDGHAQISGDFTFNDAKTLASTLNAGSLPAPISILSQRTVGATLGGQSVAASVRAGIIGIALVITFLVLLYGLKGVIAGVAMLYYGLLTLALYKLIPVTLSLPGIAGFLLSIGMAVDTIILVFERLREEEAVSHGSAAVIVSKAFGRAWGSIKDANVVTLISAMILANPFDWQVLNTSGMVRGFALTLALGIVLNLFTGMFVLRILMTLFYRQKESKI